MEALPPALNLFPWSLLEQFIAREGEAPAEPLRQWLGSSLALPKIELDLALPRCLERWAQPLGAVSARKTKTGTSIP